MANTQPKPELPVYSWTAIHPGATLTYCRNASEAESALSWLQPGDYGFDLEWRPNFRKNMPENPVALVQIASDSHVILIQISAMRGSLPPRLKDFLESTAHLKAGVGIPGDVQKLYNDVGLSTRNCVDLTLLARSVDNVRWKGSYSSPIALARLVETYHSLRLHKPKKLTLSDWQAPLSLAQQAYAANDAHAGYTILQELRGMMAAMSSPPAPRCFTFNCIGTRLYDDEGNMWSPRNPNYDPGPRPPPKPVSSHIPTASESGSRSSQDPPTQGRSPSKPARKRGNRRNRGPSNSRSRATPASRAPRYQPSTS